MQAAPTATSHQDVTAASALAYAEEGARHLAKDKNVALSIEETDPTLRLRADRGRLAQVLGNLVSNAIKFTPRAGRVHVTLVRVGSQAELTVRDTGIGIAPHMLPRIFDRFAQADSSSTREYHGLGLGL